MFICCFCVKENMSDGKDNLTLAIQIGIELDTWKSHHCRLCE